MKDFIFVSGFAGICASSYRLFGLDWTMFGVGWLLFLLGLVAHFGPRGGGNDTD